MYYTSNYFILCLILICWIFKDEGKYKGEDYTKAPKKDGKGNPYVELLNRHVPLMDAMRTASRREFLHAILN